MKDRRFLLPAFFILCSCATPTTAPVDSDAPDGVVADDALFEDADGISAEDGDEVTDDDAGGPRVAWISAAETVNLLSARLLPVQMLFKDELWVIGGYRDIQNDLYWNDVWKSADGIAWYSMPADHDLLNEKARGAAGAVHDGKMFVVTNTIADMDQKTAMVVSSAGDGSWEKVMGAPPFGPRKYPLVFSFKERLWVIGGYDAADKPLNDIYSSGSGSMWERHDETYPYAVDGVPIVFNDRAWVIGANEGGIAYSENGVSWQLQPVTAPFTGRTQLGVTTHDGRLYVTGGVDGHGTQGGLWRSTEGVVWEEVVTDGLPSRRGAVFASLQDAMVMAVGFDQAEGLAGAPFFSFNDGRSWQRLEGLTGRYGHAFLRVGDRFYIIGGMTRKNNDTMVENTVCLSTDGVSWVPVDLPQPLLNKSGMAFAFFKDRFWGIGGNPVESDSPSTGTVNEIVVSDNGMAWEVAAADPALTPRSHAAATVFKERLWVVGGFDYDGDGMNDVWVSDDGLVWECLQPDAPFTGRGRHGLHVLNDALYLVGGERYYADSGVSEVWRSTDGIVWEEVFHIAFPSRAGLASSVGGGMLWVFGGSTLDGDLGDLWVSLDGADWWQEPYVPGPAGRSGAALLFEGERLWLAGGLGQNGGEITNFGDVWYADIAFSGPPIP